jgi:phage I-like protein
MSTAKVEFSGFPLAIAAARRRVTRRFAESNTMKQLLVLTLGAALSATACGTSASDATDTSSTAENTAARAPAAAATGSSAKPAVATVAAPARPVYRDVTLPAGTTLPLSLTSSMASDTSVVEDAVTAELTRAVSFDGREILPAGTKLAGNVTEVDDSGRIRGRAMIAFRFTSLQTGGQRYDVQTTALSHVAPATKGEDATKIGIGAGAGAVIGGLLGGTDGAAKGAAIGGGAGTGVVLATKGKEMRLGPGADVTSQLSAPLTVRVRIS